MHCTTSLSVTWTCMLNHVALHCVSCGMREHTKTNPCHLFWVKWLQYTFLVFADLLWSTLWWCLSELRWSEREKCLNYLWPETLLFWLGCHEKGVQPAANTQKINAYCWSCSADVLPWTRSGNGADSPVWKAQHTARRPQLKSLHLCKEGLSIFPVYWLQVFCCWTGHERDSWEDKT